MSSTTKTILASVEGLVTDAEGCRSWKVSEALKGTRKAVMVDSIQDLHRQAFGTCPPEGKKLMRAKRSHLAARIDYLASELAR